MCAQTIRNLSATMTKAKRVGQASTTSLRSRILILTITSTPWSSFMYRANWQI